MAYRFFLPFSSRTFPTIIGCRLVISHDMAILHKCVNQSYEQDYLHLFSLYLSCWCVLIALKFFPTFANKSALRLSCFLYRNSLFFSFPFLPNSYFAFVRTYVLPANYYYYYCTHGAHTTVPRVSIAQVRFRLRKPARCAKTPTRCRRTTVTISCLTVWIWVRGRVVTVPVPWRMP